MDKFRNSWELVKASASVLKSDKELVVFPILSGAAVLILTIFFAAAAFGTGSINASRFESYSYIDIVYIYFYYIVMYTVIIFSNSALVGAATIRLRGGNPTLKNGIDIALKHFTSILGYALISATIGLILRWISDKAGIVGKIFAFISELAWNVVTFLVIPVLVIEGVGPIDAVKKSAALLKKTWGEQIIGNISIGFFFGMIGFGVFVFCFAIAAFFIAQNNIMIPIIMGVIFLLAVLTITIIISTLQSI